MNWLMTTYKAYEAPLSMIYNVFLAFSFFLSISFWLKSPSLSNTYFLVQKKTEDKKQEAERT